MPCMATFKPRDTQGTHTVHHVQNKRVNAVSVRGAFGGRMQPKRLQSNHACLAVVEKSRGVKVNREVLLYAKRREIT